jgi:hypothetical protein
MLKTTHTASSRLLLSLSLVGLLCFYAAPRTLAQDVPASTSADQPAPNAQNPNGPPLGQPGSDQPISNAPNVPGPASTAGTQSAPGTEQAEPPNRAARISFLRGSVSLQPGGEGDWGNAVMNRPVTVGDKIWVDKDSRAELQAGQATFHLGNMTALSFLNLDGPVTQVRVPEGSISFRVREMREGDIYEVDTPNVAFMVKQAGAYRIDVSENGDGTRITAIRGEGEATAGGKAYTVHPGERAEFVGTDNGSVQYTAHGAPPPDALDTWANERDLREDNSTSARYVNRDVPGVADLDDNGTWSEEPNVGSVWYPNNVGPDWAPYSDGAWNYVGPWGWSWVGYEPWGYAPYHYGRWGYYGSRWGWIPGPIYARPYYGPAFVGFVGGGFGFGIGFGFGFGGGIGWFPLGYGEPFHPWYHAGYGYVHSINVNNTVIHNTSTINNHSYNYAYAHNTHAVSAMSRNGFANGERVNRGAANISSASLRNAQVTNGAGVSPNRSSFSGAAAHTGARVATPPASVQNRSVMARTTPAAGASGEPVHSLNSSGSFNAANHGNTSVYSRSAGASAGTSTRTWAAQGNTTDHGNAPQGAGRNASSNGAVQTARVNQTNRPEWARTGATTTAPRTYNGNSTMNSNRAPNVGANRSYTPQTRAYSAPSRTYSAPSRTYSAPSRPAAAPSHSSGGAAPHASGGGAPHGGGGGGSHGGGGGHH